MSSYSCLLLYGKTWLVLKTWWCWLYPGISWWGTLVISSWRIETSVWLPSILGDEHKTEVKAQVRRDWPLGGSGHSLMLSEVDTRCHFQPAQCSLEQHCLMLDKHLTVGQTQHSDNLVPVICFISRIDQTSNSYDLCFIKLTILIVYCSPFVITNLPFLRILYSFTMKKATMALLFRDCLCLPFKISPFP